MTASPDSVRIVEVGPRDGLQNEATVLPTEAKIVFLEKLAETGLREIELGSFVSPHWVPQLSDSAEVARRLPRREGIRYTALVPNERGMWRAIEAGVESVAVFTAATESFNRKNTNAGIEESFDRFRPVLELAAEHGIRVRGYVSTAFHCPFEGPVRAEEPVRVAERLFRLGVEEVSIGDTIGMATPPEVRALCETAASRLDFARLAFHFHDTRATGLVNVMTAMERGVRIFDAAAGGLGGCPYAPGAGGNLATEDLVYLLDGLGIESGVDLDRVVEASIWIEEAVRHPLPSKVYIATRASRTGAGLDRRRSRDLPSRRTGS
ncbi:MAG: hydroxymethylglutaryl-CoA lyase [Candidatus Eisenbacteria bacterium]|nr:hydroxymethylglutaryl-CoA lyase [Candidatus Latescibacterota bacterium]MBD3301223.1 hydroxymethylglutaryl-CoA lyase [Candidatus Eisenbacteria bacterium]